MWQDDNFVRGDTITLFREQKRMESRGHVQSVLYQAKQKNGNATVVGAGVCDGRVHALFRPGSFAALRNERGYQAGN